MSTSMIQRWQGYRMGYKDLRNKCCAWGATARGPSLLFWHSRGGGTCIQALAALHLLHIKLKCNEGSDINDYRERLLMWFFLSEQFSLLFSNLVNRHMIITTYRLWLCESKRLSDSKESCTMMVWGMNNVIIRNSIICIIVSTFLLTMM